MPRCRSQPLHDATNGGAWQHARRQRAAVTGRQGPVPVFMPVQGAACMNQTNAAEQVLEENGRPMHVRDIAEQAERKGLIESDNPNVKEAIASQIRTDIKNKVDESRFVKVEGAGAAYGLRAQTGMLLDGERMRHERRIRMAQAGDRMGT